MTWKEYSIVIVCVTISFILGRNSISPEKQINNRIEEIEQRISDSIEIHQLILARFDRFLSTLGPGGIGIIKEEITTPPACPPGVDCIQPLYGWEYSFNINRIKEILANPEKVCCGYITSN